MSKHAEVIGLRNGFQIYVEHQISSPKFPTILMVNGALSTTTSFNHTIKFLKSGFNTICFDLPYSGESRAHNTSGRIVTKDDEVDILGLLAERYMPEYLISISWGGVAALLMLARKKTSISRAIIGSFSPFLNPAMIEYISSARDFIGQEKYGDAARLLNDTVGKYLPRMLKLYNYRYLSRLPKAEMQQVRFHIEQILNLQPGTYLAELQNIRADTLFVNGDRDEYTSAVDVKFLAPYVRAAQFATVSGAGHFLDLEGSHAQNATRDIIFGFLPTPAFSNLAAASAV